MVRSRMTGAGKRVKVKNRRRTEQYTDSIPLAFPGVTEVRPYRLRTYIISGLLFTTALILAVSLAFVLNNSSGVLSPSNQVLESESESVLDPVRVDLPQLDPDDHVPDEYVISLRRSPLNAKEAWLKQFGQTVTEVCNCELIDVLSAATLATLVVKGKETDIKKLVQLKEVERIGRHIYFKAHSHVNEEYLLHAQDKNVPWGLRRIAKREKESDNRDFIGNINNGKGVDVYVIDSGVDTSHPDFGGLTRFGYNGVGNESDEDLNGHGTHVAGIIAGKTFGVATESNIISLKAVTNMSLGLKRYDEDVERYIDLVVSEGMPVILSAGNNGTDACLFTPAWLPSTITVSATNDMDKLYASANYGECVDMLAPGARGHCILVSWKKKSCVKWHFNGCTAR